MMMKQDSTVLPIPTPAAVCGNCGADERRLLHHIRHRGLFRRLCTTCVLRLHPQSFCPTCFAVYDRPPPPSTDASVSCIKCYSSSHSPCVGPSPLTPYICPPCRSPSSPIFDARRVQKNGEDGNSVTYREIDQKSAKILLAAAKIAATSMAKAAVAARAEAERRAKEAAYTRKRARESLEHVAFIAAKEKLMRKETFLMEVSGSKNADGMDGPNEVSTRLNAVGLKEKERLQRLETNCAAPRAMGVGDVQMIGMVDKDKVKVNSVANLGGAIERANNVEGEKANNGLHPTQNKLGSKEDLGLQQ